MNLETLTMLGLLTMTLLGGNFYAQRIYQNLDKSFAQSMKHYERTYIWQSKTSHGSRTNP